MMIGHTFWKIGSNTPLGPTKERSFREIRAGKELDGSFLGIS